MKYDLKILQEYIDKKLIHMQVHPTLPLRIYKYSQECVFSRAWDDITLNMRGTVIDNDGNLVSNPFPKFFNFEELEPLGISLPNVPYKVYDKADGSLIEVFRYKGEIVVSSAGSFSSAQAEVAEKILREKYANMMELIGVDLTYLFELIFPANKIVLNYGTEEKLMLLAVRNTQTGVEHVDALIAARELGFDVVDEVDKKIDELKNEVTRPDFINKEGFVVVYENGFRVKMKYAEYFRLHKIISNVNEKFVWEFVSQGKPIILDNIPDETFQFIKDTEKALRTAFDHKWEEIWGDIYQDVLCVLDDKYGKGNWGKKEFALLILPVYKKYSGVLFKIYENRYDEAKEIVWKILMPKYEKGVSGFQSMKIET